MRENVVTLPLPMKTFKKGLSNQLMPLRWVLSLLKKCKEQHNRLMQNKISALEKQAYDYYLELYIDRLIKFKEVDFHPDLYLSGEIVCAEAKQNAANDVMHIVAQGEKAINRYYSILLKNNLK